MRPALDLRTASAADTQRLAAVLVSGFVGGEVVSLTGELGAGKTCFVQGAARQLQVTERITSPSFLLRRDYTGQTSQGPVTLTHFDVYRLDHISDVADLGFDDAGRSESITFVEWGDAAGALLPDDHLEVELRLADPARPLDDTEMAYDEEPRLVRLLPHGARSEKHVTASSDQLAPWQPGRPSADQKDG